MQGANIPDIKIEREGAVGKVEQRFWAGKSEGEAADVDGVGGAGAGAGAGAGGGGAGGCSGGGWGGISLGEGEGGEEGEGEEDGKLDEHFGSLGGIGMFELAMDGMVLERSLKE